MHSFAVNLRLFAALLSLHCASGELVLELVGYDDIPTDGSGEVAIADIGTHAGQGAALVCRHGITGIPSSAMVDKWLFVSANGDEEEVVVGGQGTAGFSVSRGQGDGVVRLERMPGVFPLEGTYKCSVEVGSQTETVTVYLYWPLVVLEVTIQVVSQTRERERFSVSCRAEGGRLVNSSLTGPNGEVLGQLAAVQNQQELRGADNYSLTVERTEGEDGDVFTCTAATEGSSNSSHAVLSVAGQVGSVEVAQIPSLSPTLNVSWSPPSSGGAAITSYTLHFTSSGEGRGAADHNGSVVTNGNASAAVIRDLLADGRTYGVTVEAHSLHFSSYSAPLPYTPCVVSRLLVSSRSHDSLSLDWDRPHYFTGSLRGILEYRLLHSAGSESRWLYVEGNSDQQLPILRELKEFTNYSIRMAVVDEAGRLCVFNQPLIAETGLGPVRNLRYRVEQDGIEISWSPPTVPSGVSLSYTVAYTSSINETPRITTTTTGSHSWRIRAKQGDRYTVTVTPNADSGPGPGLATATIVGIDYKSFQIRINQIEKCGDILERDTEARLVSVAEKIHTVLSSSWNCEVQIRDAQFDCVATDQDFVIFRGLLFAPMTISSAELLSRLEEWVSSGANCTLPTTNPISTDCKPAEIYSESPECVRLTNNPTTASTTAANRPIVADEGSEGSLPVALLAGAVTGSFLVGVLTASVVVLACYLLKRRRAVKRRVVQQQIALALPRSDGFENNPRYISSDNPAVTTAPQRTLPLPPPASVSNSLVFTNPIKEGACREIGSENNNDSYETLPEPGKVQNPMYEMVEEVKRERGRRGQQVATASDYEDVGQVVKVALAAAKWKKCEDEYIVMKPGVPTTPQNGDVPT